MKVRVSQDASGSTVVLSGDIDEKVTDGLRDIAAAVKGSAVIFDCDAVRSSNSLGLRQWMLFLASFGAQRSLTFRRCPSRMVDDALILPKMFGSGRIESLYLSYYCDPCGLSSTLLFEMAALKANPAVAEAKCGKCGEALDMPMDLEAIVALPSA